MTPGVRGLLSGGKIGCTSPISTTLELCEWRKGIEGLMNGRPTVETQFTGRSSEGLPPKTMNAKAKGED